MCKGRGTKAESVYEKRFDNTNQRKQTFSELSGKMVTRMEFWSAYEALKDKIEEVSGWIKVIEPKSTGLVPASASSWQLLRC
jgi:hypothetical protein